MDDHPTQPPLAAHAVSDAVSDTAHADPVSTWTPDGETLARPSEDALISACARMTLRMYLRDEPMARSVANSFR